MKLLPLLPISLNTISTVVATPLNIIRRAEDVVVDYTNINNTSDTTLSLTKRLIPYVSFSLYHTKDCNGDPYAPDLSIDYPNFVNARYLGFEGNSFELRGYGAGGTIQFTTWSNDDNTGSSEPYAVVEDPPSQILQNNGCITVPFASISVCVGDNTDICPQ